MLHPALLACDLLDDAQYQGPVSVTLLLRNNRRSLHQHHCGLYDIGEPPANLEEGLS